jgi:Na+/phosphate symporter
MFYKDEVVKMMTDYINAMNRDALFRMNATEEQINASIEQMKDELDRVNGELYDMLKTNGVIA